MNIIRASIERPIAIISAVLMVVMFGIVALLNIPIQLAPDVNRPVITVETQWFGAAPAEVEREIVNRQEDELRGLEGLEEMLGTAETGRGRIELEFQVSTDMDRALLLVANRLDRVGDYPAEVDQPTLSSAGAEDNAIAWLTLRRVTGNDRPIHTFGDFAEDVIKTQIERVPGVSRVDVYGGAEREMQLIVDPERLAHNRITIGQVVQGLRAANASISAGAVEEGKRRYTVRTEGDFESVQSVRDVVLRSTIDPVTGRVARLTVADIGAVVFDYKEPVARIRYFGEPGMAMPIRRETGANVIETMAGVDAALADLSAYDLPAEGLYINKVYDETTYITSAISLVQQNIWVGGILAAVVLMTFLRSGSATLVVSLAIPVSVVGSFVAMAALGRSINVISLAGLAFAVGMVVDAAIVVLENIFRLRQNGRSAKDAAYLGASQVWGAVLVSALTTVMVFIPILVMQLEVGQLFRDIAVAISVSVLLSLLVSVTVVPALASRLLGPGVEKAQNRRVPGVDQFARAFHRGVMTITRNAVRSRAFAASMIIALTAVCSISTYIFLPKLDYLPNGNRNLVIGRLSPPPGYNLDTQTAIAGQLENATRPIWDESEERKQTEDGTPTLSRFFFVAFRANTIIGAAAADESRVADLIPVLSAPVRSVPGTRSFFFQTSLFGRGVGGSGAVDLDISGGDMNEIVEVAQRIDRAINDVLPRSEGTQIRPLPSLTLGAPEVRLLPDRMKLADNGISALELGQTVDAFNDGLRVAEITVDGERVDLTLRGPVKNVTQTQGIETLPVVTEQGMILPASSLATVSVTTGPTEIRHRERLRTITLVVQPPASIALEESMDILRDQVIAKVVAEGVPAGVTMRLSGTASKLQETWAVMQIDLVMALAIVYLVMAILFESFLYPIIIVFSVPLATAGGMLGLGVLNAFTPQKLDMLTLLGFVILIGIVVNNAILLVHQTLHHLRDEGMTPGAAILEATGNRIRPIFMSTLTSVLGMLPLVVFPGAGSELYRGLGSVVVGGLTLSAVLTLGLIPPMLSLFMSAIEGRDAKSPVPASPPPAPSSSPEPSVGSDPKGAPAE